MRTLGRNRTPFLFDDLPEPGISFDVAGVPKAEQPAEEVLASAAAKYRAVQGGRVAAWMASKHRRALHKDGLMMFHVPTDYAVPEWARWAMAGFRARPARWSVNVIDDPWVTLRFEVKWLRHGRYANG
jgi:hypothetical protein